MLPGQCSRAFEEYLALVIQKYPGIDLPRVNYLGPISDPRYYPKNNLCDLSRYPEPYPNGYATAGQRYLEQQGLNQISSNRYATDSAGYLGQQGPRGFLPPPAGGFHFRPSSPRVPNEYGQGYLGQKSSRGVVSSSQSYLGKSASKGLMSNGYLSPGQGYLGKEGPIGFQTDRYGPATPGLGPQGPMGFLGPQGSQGLQSNGGQMDALHGITHASKKEKISSSHIKTIGAVDSPNQILQANKRQQTTSTKVKNVGISNKIINKEISANTNFGVAGGSHNNAMNSLSSNYMQQNGMYVDQNGMLRPQMGQQGAFMAGANTVDMSAQTGINSQYMNDGHAPLLNPMNTAFPAVGNQAKFFQQHKIEQKEISHQTAVQKNPMSSYMMGSPMSGIHGMDVGEMLGRRGVQEVGGRQPVDVQQRPIGTEEAARAYGAGEEDCMSGKEGCPTVDK